MGEAGVIWSRLTSAFLMNCQLFGLTLLFALPLIFGNLLQQMYNTADSIIVGKFVGEDALAAVGTSNPLMTLAILFINGLCLGAGILVSTAYGAGDTQRVERQVSTTAIAGTVFSLVFSALCVLLATPLLRLMQVPTEILPIAVQYLRIVFAGLIFTFFYNFFFIFSNNFHRRNLAIMYFNKSYTLSRTSCCFNLFHR